MADTLTHITLLTGHSAFTSRSEVSDEVIMRLQSVIDAEAGSIQEAGVYVDIIRPLDPVTRRPRPGGAAFSILGGVKPPAPLLVQCICCWEQEIARECWEMVEAMQTATGLSQSQRARCPAELPWLAVIIAPGLASAPKQTTAMLADLERCISWTLMETPL